MVLSVAAGAQEAEKESTHRAGPGGLEGWTVEFPLPDDPGQQFAGTLVVARQGRVLRRFAGDPVIFRWMFVGDGRIAYESGPLHFGLGCVLADVRTGRRVARFDCYHEVPRGAPAWVKALEALEALP